MITRHENKLIVVLIILAIYAGFFLYSTYKTEQEHFRAEEVKIAALKNLEDKIDGLSLEAKAVSIYDVDKNIKMYGKNDTEILPMASLAKTLSVIVALEDLEEDEIIISENAIKDMGDNGLFLNEKWNAYELAKFSLVLSSNDGITALSERDPDFIRKLNAKARRLGLEKTHFINASGLDVSDDTAGAYTTALEANKLAMYALRARAEIFGTTRELLPLFKSISGFEHKAQNTNIIIEKIPNILFSKTGNTDLAGGNLTIIFKNKYDKIIAVTVLGSTNLGRFTDMEKIIGILNKDIVL